MTSPLESPRSPLSIYGILVLQTPLFEEIWIKICHSNRQETGLHRHGYLQFRCRDDRWKVHALLYPIIQSAAFIKRHLTRYEPKFAIRSGEKRGCIAINSPRFRRRDDRSNRLLDTIIICCIKQLGPPLATARVGKRTTTLLRRGNKKIEGRLRRASKDKRSSPIGSRQYTLFDWDEREGYKRSSVVAYRLLPRPESLNSCCGERDA